MLNIKTYCKWIEEHICEHVFKWHFTQDFKQLFPWIKSLIVSQSAGTEQLRCGSAEVCEPGHKFQFMAKILPKMLESLLIAWNLQVNQREKTDKIPWKFNWTMEIRKGSQVRTIRFCSTTHSLHFFLISVIWRQLFKCDLVLNWCCVFFFSLQTERSRRNVKICFRRDKNTWILMRIPKFPFGVVDTAFLIIANVEWSCY